VFLSGFQISRGVGGGKPTCRRVRVAAIARIAIVVTCLSHWGIAMGQTIFSPVLPPLPQVNPYPGSTVKDLSTGLKDAWDTVLNSQRSDVAETTPKVQATEIDGPRYGKSQPFVSDRILIQPRPNARASDLEEAHIRFGARVIRKLDESDGLTVVGVPNGQTVMGLIGLYQRSGLVDFAEPDYLVKLTGTAPNDPRFLDGTLWALDNRGLEEGESGPDIDAPEGWETRKSAEGIIVAIVDSGVRYTHEDLAANMWKDPVTGAHGVNVLLGSDDPDDDQGHGTMIAGILGGVGNNEKGTVGVAWKLQIMACKFVNRFAEGAISDAIACFDFARNKGAAVINASWGIDYDSRALFNVMRRMRDSDVIVVAAAGNDAKNLERSPFYPASYDLDNIVSVAATTREDDMLFVSNFGAKSVDLGAPGEKIFSTSYMSDNHYSTDSGSTSTAAAFVSGAVALVRARYPTEDYLAIVQRVLESTDPVRALKGKCVTGGRLNLRKALGPPLVAPKFWFALGDKLYTLKMFVSGEKGRTYVVESSTDLIDWRPVFTNSVSVAEAFVVPYEIRYREKLEFFRVSYLP